MRGPKTSVSQLRCSMTRELFVPSSQMRLSIAVSAESAGRTWPCAASAATRRINTIGRTERSLFMDGPPLPVPAFVAAVPQSQLGLGLAAAPEPPRHLLLERFLGLSRDGQTIPERK